MHLSSPPYVLHAPSISFFWITWIIFGEENKSVSSSLCSFLHSHYLITLKPKYSSQHPILKHLQTMFLPQCERQCFTSTQNNRQYMCISIFTFLDSKLDDKRFWAEWQQAFPAWISSRMELIHYGYSQIFKLFYPLKGTIISLYIVTLSCILISWHYHVLCFISIYFRFTLLTKNHWSFCIFFYIMHPSIQYINIININQKLMCAI